ncbi:elongation factor P [Spiroplasma endosymbiont of Anurida maritima]|uniref:elongation factor P n=1 Tax=Spiroplasma endosymbiont of Anurida maritima TaxID=2967972 RepID=UPI0036D252E1
MINVNDLRPGMTFEYENNTYVVVDANHSKSGRGQAHVKAKVKNLRTKSNTIITFTGGEKVKKAMVEKSKMQYLYSDGTDAFFMNNETYEQITIPVKELTWEFNFLTEGLNVQVTSFKEEVLGLVLPDKITLEIIEAEAAVKGDTTSGAQKKAILETNFEVVVPLFIEVGEKVIVSTIDGKYSGRA